MPHLLVSVGTDGVTDWVRLPTGQRLNLGAISIASFISAVAGKSAAKRLVQAFLRDGEVMFRAEEDAVWDMLTPVRARWAADDGSFMGLDRTRKPMPTIHDDLNALEQHIKALTAAAPAWAAGKVTESSMKEGHAVLQKLAQKIKSPNQSQNSTYYNLGAPDVFEVGDAAPKPVTTASGTATTSSDLAVDVIEANTQTAHGIIAKAEATVAKIDRLAALGKKFNAAKAKADVHQVTSKVATILKMDLTAGWVQGDLTKLAAQTDKIHGLFASAKV